MRGNSNCFYSTAHEVYEAFEKISGNISNDFQAWNVPEQTKHDAK